MKLPVAIAAAAAGCVGVVAVTTLWAQRPQQQVPHTRTALVDMSEVMKNSARFTQAMEGLKTNYEAKAKDLQERATRGNELTQKMRQMPNGPERKQLELELAKTRADYEIDQKRITEEIRDEESKIILGLLSDLRGELERFARTHQVQLILRADPEPPNLTDPRMIMREIHKPIVYQSGLEATNPVLSALNARAGAPAARTGNAAPPTRGGVPR